MRAPDYVDYMMGHTVDVYHDIQMKGVEFLRITYDSSGLSIRPKTKTSRVEALKEIIRAWGLNLEQLLARDAFTEPHRTIVSCEDNQLQVLSRAPKDLIREETAGQIRTVGGGPEGTHTQMGSSPLLQIS